MRERLDALTSVRGVAAWWIVVFHFRQNLPVSSDTFGIVMSRGYLAVDFFFILSGFVISLSYMGALSKPSNGAMVKFYRSRFARIYPLHLVIMVLFLSVPAAILFLSKARNFGDDFGIGYYITSLFLVQNWGLFADLHWNVPAWSISAEFGAYLAFPLLAPLVSFAATTTSRAVIGAFLTLFLLTVSYAGLDRASLAANIPTTGLLRCLLEFATGSFVYQCWRLSHQQQKVWALLSIVVALGAVFAGESYGLRDFYFYPAAFTLLIFGLAFQNSFPAKLMCWKPLVFLGEISYSTYLLHYLVKYWVKFLLGDFENGTMVFVIYLTFNLSLSILFYFAVEQPCRSWLRPASTTSQLSLRSVGTVVR